METAQDIFNKEFLEDDVQNSNETLDLFEFMRNQSTALNESQLKGIMLLNEMGLHDISTTVIQSKRQVTNKNIYFKLLDKLTLADRIKGNAKLSHLMKTDGANPASQLKASDVQAQGMNRREIDRY